MEIPDGLDPDDRLTFVIGVVARTEAQLLRALLEVDLTLQAFSINPSSRILDLQRSYGDTRSGGQVVDEISHRLTEPIYELVIKRGTNTLTAVKRTLKARNYIVHTEWEWSGNDHVAHRVFGDLWGPRPIDAFVQIPEELRDLVRRVDLLRGDIEDAQKRARS